MIYKREGGDCFGAKAPRKDKRAVITKIILWN